MVAKIKSGKRLIGALNYNEHKVRDNKAELIEASGYHRDLEDLTFRDKLYRLTDLAARNERTRSNAVHISLNFATGENLEVDMIREIARDYMEGIGFFGQPYLMYKHFDSGHPHVHIVTTNITASGERIELNMLGKTRSSEARKAIEIKYGLVKADRKTLEHERPLRADLSSVIYGKTETKRAISNVVNEVVNTYKFTSIPELNAVLTGYNVLADTGAKDSRMCRNNGLVYWIIDNKGNKIGVPVKASSIYGSPTLKTLNAKFKLNKVLRKPNKDHLRAVITREASNASSVTGLQKRLSNHNIRAVLRYNNEGRLYGATFIDHNSKTVFNGSDLGKECSANFLFQKFGAHKENTTTGKLTDFKNADKGPGASTVCQEKDHAVSETDMIGCLFMEEWQDVAALAKLSAKKKRKKRKGFSL